MNLKKSFLLISAASIVLFASCIKEPDVLLTPYTPSADHSADINPTIGSTTSSSQDFIFNTDSVGFTTITIRRSEWNKMLTYYDYFYKNENLVYAESYEYEKDGTNWKLNTVGLRLRGNTSRYRPQGKDFPRDETNHEKPNYGWDDKINGYYPYAATCSDDVYRQSHFKVDFEPFDSDDRKMSDCMKGVALKRSDSVFSREIFCYNLFHQYGIWTAPRASQTKVYIKLIEDVENNGNVSEDIEDCEVTTVDFGVYEMFEEVNKQSLKGRMKKKNNNTAETAWENNDGDLWKCSGGDLSSGSNYSNNFGCEDIRILNTDKPKSKWSTKWFAPCYDLKTNKANVTVASAKFHGFIEELNNLSNTAAETEEGVQARKQFYEKWFDVDFFIKTYAVNIIVGMDDDYWGNQNNYYLYFDNGKNGSGKCYLIPFDYDNTLGYSISGDKVYADPFKWGYDDRGYKHNRPLLDRLLEVPEYKTKMENALLDVSSQDENSPWNKDNCINLWRKWHDQVAPYVYSPDITGRIGSTYLYDDGGWKGTKHYLTQDYDNIYEQVSLNLKLKILFNDENIPIYFDLNGGSVNGKNETVTRLFNGNNTNLNSIMEKPVRQGYEFIGWTKTRDGSDFIDKFSGEQNLTVYANWVDLSQFQDLSIYEIKDDSFKGIKVGIANLPENHYRRTFYINGKEVGGDEKEKDENSNKIPNPKYEKIWAYPFTEAGATYEIYVTYSDKDYHFLGESNHLMITAESGKGEFKLKNQPEFKIEYNTLNWIKEPVIQIGNDVSPAFGDNWNEYYLLEIQSTMKRDPAEPNGYRSSWNYQSWNYMGASCNNGFNFKDNVKEEVLNGTRYDLCFKFRYIYNALPYGDYYLVIYDYNDMERFNIE